MPRVGISLQYLLLNDKPFCIFHSYFLINDIVYIVNEITRIDDK